MQQPLGSLDHTFKPRHFCYRDVGVHASKETNFAAVYIADAGQIPLVEQRQSNSPGWIGPEPPDSLLGIPVRPQQIRTEMPDSSVLFAACQHLEGSK